MDENKVCNLSGNKMTHKLFGAFLVTMKGQKKLIRNYFPDLSWMTIKGQLCSVEVAVLVGFEEKCEAQ